MTTSDQIGSPDEFEIEIIVNGKKFSIDGMLVMSEMMLNNVEDNNPRQVIEVVRRCISAEDSAGLTEAQTLAIGLRLIYRLKKLGKELAP